MGTVLRRERATEGDLTALAIPQPRELRIRVAKAARPMQVLARMIGPRDAHPIHPGCARGHARAEQGHVRGLVPLPKLLREGETGDDEACAALRPLGALHIRTARAVSATARVGLERSTQRLAQTCHVVEREVIDQVPTHVHLPLVSHMHQRRLPLPLVALGDEVAILLVYVITLQAPMHALERLCHVRLRPCSQRLRAGHAPRARLLGERSCVLGLPSALCFALLSPRRALIKRRVGPVHHLIGTATILPRQRRYAKDECGRQRNGPGRTHERATPSLLRLTILRTARPHRA
mmetsp:Transcript_9358/g.38378  ORF Transcript_9358/g.38378 Transcript_9358/m.38378 type:complete len:293 (-) Transcript_9358:936-1814(-)